MSERSVEVAENSILPEHTLAFIKKIRKDPRLVRNGNLRLTIYGQSDGIAGFEVFRTANGSDYVYLLWPIKTHGANFMFWIYITDTGEILDEEGTPTKAENLDTIVRGLQILEDLYEGRKIDGSRIIAF